MRYLIIDIVKGVDCAYPYRMNRSPKGDKTIENALTFLMKKSLGIIGPLGNSVYRQEIFSVYRYHFRYLLGHLRAGGRSMSTFPESGSAVPFQLRRNKDALIWFGQTPSSGWMPMSTVLIVRCTDGGCLSRSKCDIKRQKRLFWCIITRT